MKVQSAAILLVIGHSVKYGGAFSTSLSNHQLSLGPRAVITTSAGMKIVRPQTSSIRATGSRLQMSQSAAVGFPPEENSNPPDQLLEGFGKGIARDYKARLPLYKSDITDGLNVQVSTSLSVHEWDANHASMFHMIILQYASSSLVVSCSNSFPILCLLSSSSWIRRPFRYCHEWSYRYH